jgi:7-keto-8-aminopelargonate synthetase-like enzyme
MLGSPALYRQIETRLTELLGSGDSLLLPTLTHIHASVIPVLASDGTIFVDSRAHKTISDGCVTARAHGATVVRYAHDDPDALMYVDDAHGFGVVGERDRSEPARTAAAATGWCATSARATSTWC